MHFADETVQDIALRYWERSYARKQRGWGALGLQKIPAWDLGGERLWPWVLGVRSQPAKAERPLTLHRRFLNLFSPEDVRVTSKDQIKGVRSQGSVPKLVAPRNSHTVDHH